MQQKLEQDILRLEHPLALHLPSKQCQSSIYLATSAVILQQQ